ncbi:MAG: autotransporter-associated beta strand repeat-containing protein, partial [Opitutales bacterium]|nr:autotransporter-associated beta strand repeat-containing protein [Opitutales bacterium]
ESTLWVVEAAGVIASNDGANLISYIHTDSAGVFALTADIEEQLDLSGNLKLFLGARGKVNYGKSGTTTALTAYDRDGDGRLEWLLGGGGGELIVHFQLTGDNDLILGNQYGNGTVTLTNTNNNFTGNIIFGGQITLNYVDGALGQSTVNLPYTNRIFAASNSLPALGAGSNGVLLLDNYSETSIDISGSGYADIYLGADTDKTITAITLANGDTTYRFGGTTGTLTVDTVLDDRNGTEHKLIVDGQNYSGGKVILAQAATLTGTVNVFGYDSSKTELTEGDITLGFSVDNALANASSVTIGVGGILDLNGTTQTFDTRLTTANGGIITDNSEGKTGTLILQYGSENASLNIGELGTLQLDSGRFQAPANHAKNVVVNDGGQYHATAGTHSAVFTLAGTGWNASSDSAKDGALRLEGGAEITGGVSLAGDASVQVYHDTDAGTISGVVSTGEYTLTKIGDGTLTLDAAVSGNLAMSAGTMIQRGSFSGTLAMNGGNLTLAGSSYASGSVIDLNAGTTTLSFGDRAFSATLNVNNGATANLTTTDGLNYNGSSSVIVNSGGTLNLGSNRWTLASGNRLTLAGGTVSGEGQTATNDAGEVTGRYGALDFYQSGNVVDVTASSGLSANVRVRGSVDFAIADGATLDFSGNLYKSSDSGANFTKSGTGTLNFSGTADAGVNLALNAGTTTINSQDFRGNISVAENATLSLAGTLVLSQAVANSGSVTVDNTDITFDLGNLTISEDNVYTLISGGTITNWELLTRSNFTVGGVVLSGRSGFDLGTSGTVTIDLSQTAASLVWASQNGSNVWNVEQATNWDNAGTVDKFYDGDAVTFSTADAAIDITENVIAGNVTATENVSFTSTTTGGVVFTQIEGGIISVADGKTVAFDKTISTTGTLEIAASNGGTVSVAADAGTVTSSVVVNEGSRFGLSVADASDATYSGVISGAGSFEKLGAGTLIFDTAQTYTGGTYISGGTLKITN